ncbi:MAG: sugar ABC transporter permease [Ruminococcaceae bacterium]|nr:sugar ABC transporter permease [Oscillospiraceae bacterium]
MKKNSKLLGFIQKYTMIIALVLVVVIFSITTDGKLLFAQNINNLISQNAYVFVLATGMLLCILTGGNIDLSVGSVLCFCGAVGGTLLSKNTPIILAVLAMLGIGLAIGAWQAFWIAYVRVPPFITTLSGMLVFRGLANVVLDAKSVRVSNEVYLKIFGGGAECFILKGEAAKTLCLVVGVAAIVVFVGATLLSRINRAKKGYTVEKFVPYIIKTVAISAVIAFFAYKLSQFKGLPTVLIWIGLVVGTYSYITSKTTIGRHFYAVGGNEKAAKLSGINTNRVYFLAYTSMGMLAALSAMLVVARMASATPQAGESYEMDAIGSCFIGGASAYGGIGTVPGVIIGALLMGVINMGMSIMGVDMNYQKVVKGLVLLAAVIFDVATKKKNS